MNKIHILGAPGSGTTTFGKKLAKEMGCTHFDTDDFYWFTEDPLRYRRKRNTEHRRKLLTEALESTEKWVLSGALCGWGDVFIPQFEKVIYLSAPIEIRLARIRDREIVRFGADRINEGGDLHLVFERFLQWAANYDTDIENIRSRKKELDWLEKLDCEIIWINN
jgi:adenylate kinase family enzyme